MGWGSGNLGGGGGSTGPLKKGTIVVSYPAGASCTVTNGSKTYTALDTSGAAAFSVDAGIWTVRAYGADGDTSESVSVAVGGWVSVSLNFSLILFGNGADNTAVTGGWSTAGLNAGNTSVSVIDGLLTFKNKAGSTSNNGQWIMAAENMINLTAYSVLRVTIESSNVTSAKFGISTARTYAGFANSPAATLSDVSAVGTYELDISSFTGDYYIGWSTYQNYNQNRTVAFSLIELVP